MCTSNAKSLGTLALLLLPDLHSAPQGGTLMNVAPWRRWQLRIASVQQARRVYARALHMNPGRSSAWGDVASTFYIEAQLRRAHSRLCPEDADALCGASVTCVKGVLRHLVGLCVPDAFGKISPSSSTWSDSPTGVL